MDAMTDSSTLRDAFAQVRTEVGKAVVGQDGAVTGLMIALLANGHVLLEGVPGVAKTLLIRTLSHALRLDTNKALVEAIAMYRSAGYKEVDPFNDEPYADHWFEKRLGRAAPTRHRRCRRRARGSSGIRPPGAHCHRAEQTRIILHNHRGDYFRSALGLPPCPAP